MIRNNDKKDSRVEDNRNSDEALIEMCEHINHHSSATSEKERERHLGNALSAARRSIRNRSFIELDKNIGHADQEADDVASEAVKHLMRDGTWLENSHGIISDGRLNELPVAGDNTPLKGYLYTVTENKMIDALRKRTRAYHRNGVVIADCGPEILAKAHNLRTHKSIRRQVIVRTLCRRALEIEDEYLDKRHIKGVPIKQLIGEWRISKEWAGITTEDQRPKTIPLRTLQSEIKKIRQHIHERMVNPEDPSL